MVARGNGRRWGALLAFLTLLGLTAPAALGLDTAHASDAHRVASTTTDPVRIMLAGDSITQQFGGDYTWRHRLANMFARQDVPVDFVGKFHNVYGVGAVYLDQGGWTDDQHGGIAGTMFRSRIPKIGQWISTYKPDVLMVELGTNDFRAGDSAATVEALARTYLKKAWAADHDLPIAIATVFSADHWPTTHKLLGNRNVVYNRWLARYVAALRADGRPIRLIPLQTSAWNPRTMTADGIHPNPTGETYIAHAYGTVLHQMAVLPSPVLGTHRLAWKPDATPNLAVGRAGSARGTQRRVWFGWRKTALSERIDKAVIRIYSSRWKHPRVIRVHNHHYTVTTALPPGHYRVTLQPIRRWTTGLPGPAVSLTVA